MSEGTPIEIKPAKGRPFLQWVGKQPLRRVVAYPAQQVEAFSAGEPPAAGQGDLWQDWPAEYPCGGLLFYGDNKDVLAHLLANGFRGKVKVIYIDPPFDSGADYVRRVELRGIRGTTKLEGDGYSIGEQIQYADIWTNDNYLQFMYERLNLLKELLREDGAIFVHCDWHRAHQLRFLLEEVFGADNFRNEIIWAYPGREMHIDFKFNAKHDTLLFVAKSNEMKINMNAVALEYDRNERIKGLRRKIHTDPDGREWVWETRGQAAGQQPYKRYIDEIIEEGKALNDVWDDLQFLRGNDPERTGFPTQKPEALIERIILASSDPGDIVFDCFVGSGTTAAVAQKLGRRWIVADINKGAIQTTAKRLQTIMQAQSAEARAPRNLSLFEGQPGEDGDRQASPAQLSFAVYRVNDYDLQIQHNEAVNLACEHLGVTRTKTDSFFDGVLGKKLVKIVPFNHPLTPLDLEEVRLELANRPEEARDVAVVSLGKELAADAWLEEWNKLRSRGDVPNKIEAIELRTDPRVGGFFAHEPAQAQVEISRQGDTIRVEIKTFISPTILERLRQQSGLLSAQITDWRSMVDCVMIDPAYDGRVFNIALADVPEKKTDLVDGAYTLPAPEGETTVAVKIVDMLGEEVLVVRRV